MSAHEKKKKKKKMNNQIKYQKLLKKFLSSTNKINQESTKNFKPNQMLSRLPITLAQLKAENNSDKLKNEIRQLSYSLYGSEKLTRQLYKSLINII